MSKKTNEKMKILWNSNAIWGWSGYSQQTQEIVPLIKNKGYDIATIAFWGLEGAIIDWNGIKCYPKLYGPYGDDAMIEHGKDFKADITIALQDSWTLNPQLLTQIKNLVFWVPIDHDPVTEPVINNVRLAYRVISMSKFGQEQLRKHGIHSTFIPHSVNTDIFKNYDNKNELRNKIGIPEDAIVVGMVAANQDNPPRKSFQESMDAFKIFREHHSNAIMYIHAPLNNPTGFPIMQYAKFIGIDKSVYHTPDYAMRVKIDKNQMAKLYNTFDMLLLPSISEGFGIPAIEAQSCEVPILVNKFTALEELIIPGKTGEYSKVAYKRYSAQGSYFGVPDVNTIYEGMEKILSNKAEYGKNARQFILDNYATSKVFKEKWIPWLEQVSYEVL